MQAVAAAEILSCRIGARLTVSRLLYFISAGLFVLGCCAGLLYWAVVPGQMMTLNGFLESQIHRINIFFDPHSSMFWPFLVIGLPFAAYAWLRDGQRSGNVIQFLKYLFPKSIWRARSARQDVLFFVFMPMIMAGVVYYIVAAISTIPGHLSALMIHYFGTRSVSAATWGDRFAVTVISYLMYDFGFYLVHYLEHRVPLLWKYHKVHHSPTVLTPLTDFRAHPVQLALTVAVGSLLASVVVGIFLYFNGTDAREINYLGVNIFDIAFYSFASVLRHSHVWISFGPLSYLVISPAMHQIHHSREERHLNKNLSGNLAIWDWLFGTIYVPKTRERFRMGIGLEGQKMNRKSFFDLMVNP